MSRCRLADQRRSAFTLVEVLVSLAVIAILIGLLVPAFSIARESARKNECQSRLRQVGLAFEMYLERHRDTYPAAPRFPSLHPDKKTLMQVLGPYIENNSEVFICPSDSEYFEKQGTSYEYPETRVAGKTRTELLRRDGVQVRERRHVWVLYDYDSIHSGTRNFLHADGSIMSLAGATDD